MNTSGVANNIGTDWTTWVILGASIIGAVGTIYAIIVYYRDKPKISFGIHITFREGENPTGMFPDRDAIIITYTNKLGRHFEPKACGFKKKDNELTYATPGHMGVLEHGDTGIFSFPINDVRINSIKDAKKMWITDWNTNPKQYYYGSIDRKTRKLIQKLPYFRA